MPQLKGWVPTSENIKKRAETRRKNALGNRWKEKKGKKQYWMILTEEGRRYEHRAIMEKLLNRKLLRSEHIHHKDGNGLNNSPENLELLTAKEHYKCHIKERTKSQFIFARELKEGQWAWNYDCCVICNRNQFKHRAKGICSSCWAKKYRLCRSAVKHK